MYLSLVGANIQTANCHKRRLGEQCIYTAYSLFIEVVIWDVFHVPPWRNDKARGLVQKRHNDVWLYPTDCIYTDWTIIYRRLLIDEQIENHVCTCRKAMKAGRVFNISAAGLRDSVKKKQFFTYLCFMKLLRSLKLELHLDLHQRQNQNSFDTHVVIINIRPTRVFSECFEVCLEFIIWLHQRVSDTSVVTVTISLQSLLTSFFP